MVQARRRPRGSLHPERIIDAAFDLADEVGLAAFTMPELAARLDVGVTGLYWHFRTKDALLLAMSAPAVARLDALMLHPTDWAPEHWPRFLRAYFVHQQAVYRAHPLLTDITIMRGAGTTLEASRAGYAGVERVLAYLAGAGLAPTQAWRLYSTLSLFSQGTAASERYRALRADPPAGALHVELLGPDTLPTLAQVVRDGDRYLDFTGGAGFEEGVDAILAGFTPSSRGDSTRRSRGAHGTG